MGAAACDGEGMRRGGGEKERDLGREKKKERDLGRENAREFDCVPLLLLKLLKAGADVHTQALNPGP